MKNKTSPSNLGTVVSVRGSVVDIRFDEHLPPVYSLLHAKEGEIAIEVLAQLNAHRVRGIALTPTQGLARGMAAKDTGGPLKAPVGKGLLSRMFDVFGNAIDRQAAPSDVQWRTVHRAPLPLDETWRRELAEFPWPTGNLPEVMGGGTAALRALIREYLFVSLFRACAESLASENSSRLAAMQRADKNIDELLEDLNGTFHRLRQNSIDEELFEVIAGFEALSKARNASNHE
jgi:hypothetical protein